MKLKNCPMKASLRLPLLIFTTALCLLVMMGAASPLRAQSSIGEAREYGRMMLDVIKSDVKKNYYDPTFHGIDLDARFKAAAEKLKTAPSMGQINAILAQTLVDFNDSHLYYIPLGGFINIDHGWSMKLIGDKCYITEVKAGSDAESKGLKVGDVVWSINGFGPTRDTLWKITYYYFLLNPKTAMTLVVDRPNGKQQFDLAAKVEVDKDALNKYGQIYYDDDDIFRIEASERQERLRRHKLIELDKNTIVWKMPEFDLTEGEVADKMDKVKNYQSLVLDLRGNGGGAELTLVKLLGYFFDREVKVGELKRRKEAKPLIVKKRNGAMFGGKLAVLVDSESGSAAELFARVIQLEKRGTVLGDQSAGAVMRAREYDREVGLDTVIAFAVSITDADITMADGKSLEHVGVTPDELLNPTGEDLAAKRDPVLARAATLVGSELTPEKAGALYPVDEKVKTKDKEKDKDKKKQ